MAGDHGALRHNAYIYEAADSYVDRTATFLKEGLAAGEGAVVVNTRPGLAAMREALGDDADRVRFVDAADVYTRPAKAIAFYHRVYAEQLEQSASLRVVSHGRSGPERREWDEWAGFEAALNRSFSHLPAWLICSYNGNSAPDPVLETVWRTHTDVITDAGWNKSDRFAPADLLGGLAPEPEPIEGLRSIPFEDLEQFREALARELIAEQVPQAKVLEMLLAASELAANAIEHGGGVEDVRVGRVDGRFVCEVVDAGSGFDDPAAGYLAPREDRGKGLWVARQLAWQIDFLESPGGFTARIWL